MGAHKHWGDGWAKPRDVSHHERANELADFEDAFSLCHNDHKGWGWQRHVVASLTSRTDGKPTFGSYAIMAQRQEGKTALSEGLLTMWLMSGRRIAYAWHERRLGRVRLLRLADKLERLLGASIETVRSMGFESVSLGDGRIDLMTATDTGARGDTYDIVLVDEALEATLDFVAAVQPTMSTSAHEQMIYISSAGKPTSLALREAYDLAIDDIGRTGSGLFGCYALGATPQQAAEPDNRRMWAKIMPTLGLPGGVKMQSVAADFRRMRPGEFARERLGIWSEDDELSLFSSEQMDGCIGNEYELRFSLR